MRRRAAILLMAAGLAGPVAAAAPVGLDQWAGVYKTRFENSTVNGGPYPAEDILEIVKLSPNTAYVRTHMEFANGHLCAVWGVADLADDQLTYRSKPSSGEPRCVLRLKREHGRIAFHDDYSCKAYCGVRGSFEGASFPLSARRPIRYMPRLKDSREFKQAVAERGAAR